MTQRANNRQPLLESSLQDPNQYDEIDQIEQRNIASNRGQNGRIASYPNSAATVPVYPGPFSNPNCNDGSCKYLKENTGCIEIRKLDEEQKEYDKNGIEIVKEIIKEPKTPLDEYLKYCKKYSTKYLLSKETGIKDYYFTKKDFINGVLSPKIIDFLRLNEPSKSLNDDASLRSNFHSDPMKIFTDLLFHEDRQILMVKTWQRVEMTIRKKGLILNENTIKKVVYADSSMKNRGKLTRKWKYVNDVDGFLSASSSNPKTDAGKSAVSFYIKTIQFFKFNSEIQTLEPINQAPILVEQCFGQFSDFRMYDTDTLKYNGKVYYFKRFFKGDKNSIEAALRGEQNHPAAGERFNGIESQLQLFSFDLKKGEEEEVKGYFHEERYYKQPGEAEDSDEMLNDYVDQFTTLEDISVLLSNYDIFQTVIQYNVTFSKPFGPIVNQVFKDKDKDRDKATDFLCNQYYTYQQYILKNIQCPIKVYKLGLQVDQDDLLLADTANPPIPKQIDKINDMNQQFNDKAQEEKNRQVQYINHHQEYIHGSPNGPITFVIQNMIAMVQIVLENTGKKSSKEWKIHTYQRQENDLFQKLWYNNGIQVQKVKIEQQKEGNQLILGDQYFFYDNRNQIQVLWPNYTFKVDRLKCQELIAGKMTNTNTNLNQCKKIVCVCQDKETGASVSSIVFQKFKNLENILANPDPDKTTGKQDNLPNINSPQQQMTFCCDNKNNQILYIMDTINGKISILRMKESECVTCQCAKNSDLLLSVKSVAFIKAQQKNQVRAIMRNSGCNEDKANSMWSDKVKARIDQSAQRYQHSLSSHDPTTCNICEEDLDFQYTSYQEINDINIKRYGGIQNIPVKTLDPVKEKKNHVFIEDMDGKKVKIKTYETDSNKIEQKKKYQRQEIKLVYYQPSHDYQLFIFVVTNNKANPNPTNEEYQNSDKSDTKKSYIIIRKTLQQMQEIVQSECTIPLIKDRENEEVLILKSNKKLERIRLGEVNAFQFPDQLDDNESIDENLIYSNRNKDRPNEIEQVPYIDIKIGINKITQDHTQINFIPLVYQECQNLSNNKLLVFDVNKNDFDKNSSISINQGNSSLKYMYTDELGFNCFTMSRVSDVYESENSDKNKRGSKKQWAKYQLFTLFNEKLGRFSCSEYLITYDENGITLQTIGMKDLLLSNKIINSYDWSHIKNSLAVPFYDECGSIKGSQFVMKLNQDLYSAIDLLDQDKNTIYKYQSEVIFTGRRKFIIQNDESSDKFVMVTSTQFRAIYIEKNILSAYESYKILRTMNLLTIGMRSTNLRYLIMNDFEDIKRKDFFRCQELLLGKTVMDLCLSDSNAIEKALKNYNVNYDHLEGSLLDEITLNDKSRKETLKEVELYPKIMLLNFDFNLVGTIQRAIEEKSYKSLKIIVEHFFETINTFDYYDIFMHDLDTVLLLKNRQFEINEFFNSQFAQREKDSGEQTCTIEVKFKNNLELKVFSKKKEEYIKITEEFEDFQNYEIEVSKKITDYEKNQQDGGCLSCLKECWCFNNEDEENFYEVEHRYINFQPLIMGQKIRNFDNVDKIKFNDIFYSKFMLNYTNMEFYQMDSVQKFIDYQWSLTQTIMRCLFYMYMYLFLIPVTINLFSQDENLHYYMMNIATFPMVILTFIEIVQFKAQKWAYFQGWNFIDLTQIIVFYTLQIMRFLGVKEEKEIYISELQLLQIVLAFSKLGYYIKVYENYGFLIFMLVECVSALFPFIMTYILLIFCFSIFYIVLNLEIDPEVRDAQALAYFPKILIQVARTSFGELMMPMYSSLLKREDSIFKTINLNLIWMFWFIQVFFILVIMTNFLIAVITTTFDQVVNRQKIVSYQQKAEINAECFLLKDIFTNMESYKIVVLSTGKEASALKKDPLKGLSQRLKQFLRKEITKVKIVQEQLQKNMKGVIDGQNSIEKEFENGFNAVLENQKQLKQALMKKLNQ